MTLSEYLAATGQTLTAFASILGERVTTVHGWVSGRRMPTVPVVVRIERITEGKVRAADFVAGPTEAPAADSEAA